MLCGTRAARQLEAVAKAESLDDFAAGCKRLFGATMAYHSLFISFSGLDYFCPWLIRDTVPAKCDVSYVTDRYDRLNPTQPFLRKNMGVTLSVFQEQLGTMRTPDRQAYLERFKQHEGWDKYAEIYFWNGNTLQAHICVRRSTTQPDFTRDDLRLLGDLREAFSTCVRQLHRHHRERLTSNSLQQVLGNLPIPIIILDWDLQPICFNTAARAVCAEWIHGAAHARALKLNQFETLPAEVVAACEAEKHRLSSISFRASGAEARFAPRFRSISHPLRGGLSAQLEVLELPRGLIAMPNFIVRFQRAPSASLEQGTFERSAGPLTALTCLTRCEREVALLVSQGLGNQDIATRLSKSLPTVKMQLQSIFRKLDVSSRTQVVALLK
jgi:DNA-binding CsgD family transcriptional regulator